MIEECVFVIVAYTDRCLFVMYDKLAPGWKKFTVQKVTDSISGAPRMPGASLTNMDLNGRIDFEPRPSSPGSSTVQNISMAAVSEESTEEARKKRKIAQ